MRVSKRNCIFLFALSVLRRYFPYKKAVITLSVLFRFHIPVDDSFAVKKIGYLRTDKNIIRAVIITERNRRNLFVYYLPVTEQWQVKVMSNDRSVRGNKLQQFDKYGEPIYLKRYNTTRPRLSHSEFWKQRGGLTSYSDLQEQFFIEVSKRYGAKRGESFSLIKNTSLEQRERFNRSVGDDYDDLYFDDLPYG